MFKFFKNNKEKDYISGAIIGAILGDAMGAPFEYICDKTTPNANSYKINNLKLKEVSMWSDDSSMILSTMDSLIKEKEYNTKSIADSYLEWLYHGKWTPQGVVLDCGRTTANAMRMYRQKGILTGLNEEEDCGNGSLMRMSPIIFYVHKNKENRFNIIIDFSSITHSNIICVIACSIYVEFALNLLDGLDKFEAYKKMQSTILDKYKDYPSELKRFSRILNETITNVDYDTIHGTGYVIHSLEASLYSFLNSKNYMDCLYKAISIGHDTDTIGCVAGGLAGLYYGYDDIPLKFINQIARKDDILDLTSQFKSIYK